jgi:hypothetical protein
VNTPGFNDLKNSVAAAAWGWRWHLQGGSRFWVARDLTDLRNDDQLRQWRGIECSVRELLSRRASVISIAVARRKMRA